MTRSEKKCFYFYEFKLFIKERLTVTDKIIKNNIDFINNSKILKDKQEKKDNRNQELLSENDKKKSLKALDNSIIIFNKEENTNILDFRLKKLTFFS